MAMHRKGGSTVQTETETEAGGETEACALSERQRQRKTETEIQRAQRDRGTYNRDTERQRDRDTKRQRDREAERQTYRGQAERKDTETERAEALQNLIIPPKTSHIKQKYNLPTHLASSVLEKMKIPNARLSA